MQAASAVKPITPVRRIVPAISRSSNDARPQEIRYGWCPFADINLVGPDGTTTYYVQPHEIADEHGDPMPNPYHRVLPKGQLLPFPTFNAIAWALSEDQKDSKGSAIPVQTTRASTALENIVTVLRVYSGWGFTILPSLQGLDQETAGRIFQIVQPFDYPMKDIEAELEFGALERIEAEDDLIFDLGDGEKYHVTALFSEDEREIARQLASEMSSAAGIGFTHATTLFDDSIMSINNKLSGGHGKTGPDRLDLYLAAQLGRESEFPSVAGRNGVAGSTAALETKIDYLVKDAEMRKDKEEIARLKAELDALRSGNVVLAEEPADTEITREVEPLTCGVIKIDGTPCKVVTTGGPCHHHQEKEDEE